MKLKNLIIAAVVTATAIMPTFLPTCSAENWQLMKTRDGGDLYIDWDSAWYNGEIGGFINKLVMQSGYAAIYHVKFKDYSNGVDMVVGQKELFDSSGHEVDSGYGGNTTFYKRGTYAWRQCMTVKEHCGY